MAAECHEIGDLNFDTLQPVMSEMIRAEKGTETGTAGEVRATAGFTEAEAMQVASMEDVEDECRAQEGKEYEGEE